MTTSDITTRSEAALQLVSDATDCAAVLPYWPIWAAAQFATTDEAKQLLQFVHVFRDGDSVQIESTDGFRAFRYRLPAVADGMDSLWRVPEQGLLLHAKALRKAVPYARLLTLTSEMRAVFHGGKKAELKEISSVNMAGHYTVFNVVDCGKVGLYPNINQLWPDKFSNSPEAAFAFGARLLKDWAVVVERLSPNGTMRIECNGSNTPFVFSADYEGCIGQHYTDAQMQLLLMPVQLRK